MKSVIALLLLALAGSAGAQPMERPRVAYLEVFGKGGLGGVGYDVLLVDKIGVGAAASFYVIDESRILSFSPYGAYYLLGDAQHRWFLHGGPQIMRVAVRSAVPEWPGTTSTGIGVELSSGWEYRDRVLVRVFAMGAFGKGGFEPWLGISVGWPH